MPTTTRKPSTWSSIKPAQLPFTADEEANRLIAADPNALLIGFVLDQQVTVQKAFAGPLEIRRRAGTLDPGKLASMDPAKLAAIFAERPAIHRFPGSMAARVQALCSHLVWHCGGDASRVWNEATSGDDLVRRIGALPGFGPMKARTVTALLIKQYGVKPPGWEQHVPNHPTLGDVTTPEELAEYQTAKRAHKAELRAAGLAPRRPARKP